MKNLLNRRCDVGVNITSSVQLLHSFIEKQQPNICQIGNVDDKVMDYFPDYKVKRGEKTIYDVTIRHLLNMRTPYKGKGDPWSKVCASDNWTYASYFKPTIFDGVDFIQEYIEPFIME